tara:strand:- start:1472 stop:2974 length:1503 start_codon:yes stop_codon:yes gene_type:complete
MLRQYRKFGKAVADFLKTVDQPFATADVVSATADTLPPDTEDPEELVDDLLCDHGERIFERWADDRLEYVPRRSYFKGARFRIALTPYERKNRILVPGHRFIPFCNPTVMPFEVQLNYRGELLSTRSITCCVEDMLIYHSLLPPAATAGLLLAHRQLDSLDPDALAPAAQVEMDVFDLDAVFEHDNISDSDTLLCTVTSWENGCYDVVNSPLLEREFDFASVRRWSDTLEQLLIGGFDELGPTTTVSEQLAQALFAGPPFLLTEPGMHFGGFLSWSREVRLRGDSTRTFLWFRDEEPPELFELFDEDVFNDDGDGDGELESLMEFLGLSVNEDAYEAFIRDELFSGGNNLDNVVERILTGRPVDFSEEHRQAFIAISAELWDDISADYDRERDAVAGPLRQCVLEIFTDQVKWIRRLDRINVDIADLPQESFVAFSQVASITNMLLTKLNDPDDEELAPEQIREIEKTMEMTRLMMQEMKKRIETHIRESRQDKWMLLED